MIESSYYAAIAFCIEFCTRSLAQCGFLMQKLAHRDLEKLKEMNKDSTLELDKTNAGKIYCSIRWLIGFALILLNVAVHSLVLPFVDLTLLSCNAATAIIVNIILAVKVLNEKFIWQYDLSAMILISSGSIIIAFNAHTEQVDFTPE